MRKNSERQYVELSVESIGFEGKAIARLDGLVYFVEGAVAGDTVRAEVRKKKKNYAEAKTVEILAPSPFRVQPACRHFGDCGGCKWQHLVYNEQVAWKTLNVRDSFERLGKVEFGELRDTLPCDNQFFYRNKMEFSFGDSRWLSQTELDSGEEFRRDFALGLHVPGRFDKVFDVEECFLQADFSNEFVRTVRQKAIEYGATVFETRTHKGFLRNLVVRNSRATGEIMVILVSSPLEENSEGDAQFLAWFEKDFPDFYPNISTLIHAVSRSKASVAGGEPRIIKGSGFITEKLLGVEFRVSPFSFFQTNTAQAERLFRVALDFADLSPDKTLWDLYCGAGSITLCAASRVKKAIGIEIVESAIADARANAERNSVSNVEFYLENLGANAEKLLNDLPKPDVIIVDPPRAGLHPDVTQKLLDIHAPTIVYVSCNPATQARDCGILAEKYRVGIIQPVDMFPNTYHIESVALLRAI